jgi:hypothetical protein
LAETQAGELIFPEVVRRLLEVGVESYFCDLATGAETFAKLLKFGPSLIIRQSTDPAILRPNQEREIKLN